MKPNRRSIESLFMPLLDSTSVSLASARLAVPVFGILMFLLLVSHGWAFANLVARLASVVLLIVIAAATAATFPIGLPFRSSPQPATANNSGRESKPVVQKFSASQFATRAFLD